MKKSILLIIIFLSTCHANIDYIKELQAQFNEEVLEIHVYKKRFNQYLETECNDDLQCYKDKISHLKSWDTVKKDNKLLYLMTTKKNKLQFDDIYWSKIVTKLKMKNLNFQRSEFISVIDLENQKFIIVLWDEEEQEYQFIGQDFISSGNMQREKEVKYGENHYLKTPTGVFNSKVGWRSDGKKNEDNITLGYGRKDRYVFYFGKHDTIRYNTFDKNKQKILNPKEWKLITDQLSFAVHSHQSSKQMGTPNSHGCIRMTDELNRFLDNNSVLHKNMFNNEKWLHKYSKKPKKSSYLHFAGEYLVIFDKI